MGVHHDNFDLWNSKYTRWNAVNMGPKKDVVGMWEKAARQAGPASFGVSEHLWISYKWFAVSHGADKTGPLAGVPYDGLDPAFADLYHEAACRRFGHRQCRMERRWNSRLVEAALSPAACTDLIDKYQPDLLYTDGHCPLRIMDQAGLASLQRQCAAARRTNQAVYTSKQRRIAQSAPACLTIERGVADQIRSQPWQTDTCIGDWHYKRGRSSTRRRKGRRSAHRHREPKRQPVAQFPLPNTGVLDSDELHFLDGITDWMQVNSEGIYATRPWKIYGEGPAIALNQSTPGAAFNERKRKPLTADDFRFTTKGPSTIYAFVMGWPRSEVVIQALGAASPQTPGRIVNVELLGYKDKLNFQQQSAGLHVQLPADPPSGPASQLGIALKISM